VLRTGYFPRWTGVALIATAVILAGIYGSELIMDSSPSALQDGINIADISLAATVIYMCIFGLSNLPSPAYPGRRSDRRLDQARGA
jgi:hypothetical protein